MPIPSRRAVLGVCVAALLAGCAGRVGPPDGVPPAAGPAARWVVLFDAAAAIQDRWRHVPLAGSTEYRLTAMDGGIAIRAVGRNAASGLVRRVAVDAARCPVLEWQWRVDALQPSADLRVKGKEDVAAALFLLFGDPGLLTDPVPVPTLRYVWTTARHATDAVIDSPYLPGTVRSVVVRAGRAGMGAWRTERRDLARDYRAAFGAPPKDGVHAVALFTDNDQTQEPVVAYYRWARVVCGE